ncbi:MAG: response regulator [Salinivirgaceae bacterium]|jgi:signal transduction histidine kinase|nr:response regulator [Salinivirgaceae bacterium]
MTHSDDKNNIFDDNFGQTPLSDAELFDMLQQSVLQHEVIAEIVPILTNDNAISSQIIVSSLKKINSVTRESIGLYGINKQKMEFYLRGQFSDQPEKSIFPDNMHYGENPAILAHIRRTNTIQLGDTSNETPLQQFFHQHFNKNQDKYWVLPLQIKEKLYGFLIIQNPNQNTINNLLYSFYKSVALVFAQAFDRVAVIATNTDMLQKVNNANQLKTAFLTNISHEVRTPVNSIVGFSDLLADPDLTIDQREEFITMITKSSRHLVKMFDNIIDASKLQSQQISFRKEWVDIGTLFSEIEHEVTDDKDETQTNDKVIFQTYLPGSSDQYLIYTDKFRFMQVVGKLIENAQENTPEGTILLAAKEQNNKLIFYVEDSGVGIDPQKNKEVFNLFDKSTHAFTFESGGTGLGLSIAKEMTTQLGGKMYFDSETSVGTTFYMAFDQASYKVNRSENKKPDTNSNDWSSRTILVAEDVEFNFIFLREILVPTGANVIWAKNGAEACAVIDENTQVDLILMDLQMPEMNGYEAAEYIKKAKPTIPIIAQTAFMMANEDEKCFKIGCDGFLSKPIRPRQLIGAIKKFFV